MIGVDARLHRHHALAVDHALDGRVLGLEEVGEVLRAQAGEVLGEQVLVGRELHERDVHVVLRPVERLVAGSADDVRPARHARARTSPRPAWCAFAKASRPQSAGFTTLPAPGSGAPARGAAAAASPRSAAPRAAIRRERVRIMVRRYDGKRRRQGQKDSAGRAIRPCGPSRCGCCSRHRLRRSPAPPRPRPPARCVSFPSSIRSRARRRSRRGPPPGRAVGADHGSGGRRVHRSGEQLVVGDLVLGLLPRSLLRAATASRPTSTRARTRSRRPTPTAPAALARNLANSYAAGLLLRRRVVHDVVRGAADEHAAVRAVGPGHRPTPSCTFLNCPAANSCEIGAERGRGVDGHRGCRRCRPRGSGRCCRRCRCSTRASTSPCRRATGRSGVPVASSNVTFVARAVRPLSLFDDRVARLCEPVLDGPRVGLQRDAVVARRRLCTILCESASTSSKRGRRLVRVEPGAPEDAPCRSRGSGSSR